MKEALTRLTGRYRRADIFVLGYYQILADRIGRHATELLKLFDVLNICDPEVAKRIDFVSRAVENSKLFQEESDRQLKRAIREVGRNFNGRMTFVPSTYTAANGLFGRDALLFELGDRDPQLDNRVIPCTRAILRRRTKVHCYLASVGHPDKKGVTRYLNSLKQAVLSG